MKKLILLFSLFVSISLFSQQSEDDQIIAQLTENAIVDKTDKTILKLLDDFYDQALQSDKGELNTEIQDRIKKLYNDKQSKNMQILTMFLVYQEHINETAAVGKPADTNFQMKLLTRLENDLQGTYGKIPIIIYIYKAEALNSMGNRKESARIVSTTLNKFPDSIPLKVYQFMETKEPAIKEDLLKNHANHWMVKQFNIN